MILQRISCLPAAMAAIALLSTHASAQTVIVDKLASYDPLDASAALQEAIDTPGITKVLLRKLDDDSQSLPWILGQQIDITKKVDLELKFEAGVTVVAKAGAFKGMGDNLFRVTNCQNITFSGYGATLMMRKADYQDPARYTPSEFRTILAMHSSQNIIIEGLTFRSSGGDGIYLSRVEDVVIRNIVSDNNHRQGMSVIGAKNLLVEDSTFKNTDGASPQAGIDFEPNGPGYQLTNIVIRNCTFENNTGGGILISPAPRISSSLPVDIRIENVTIVGGFSGIDILGGGHGASAPSGTVVVEGATIKNTRFAGLLFRNKFADGGLNVTINNVTLTNVGIEFPNPANGIGGPISFVSLDGLGTAGEDRQGGANFLNVTVNDTQDRPFLTANTATQALGVKNIAGNFTVNNPNGIRWDLLGTDLNDPANGVNIEAAPPAAGAAVGGDIEVVVEVEHAK